MNRYAELAARLRVFKSENIPRLRSSLYYGLPTILAALDIAAASDADGLSLSDLIQMAEAECGQVEDHRQDCLLSYLTEAKQ